MMRMRYGMPVILLSGALLLPDETAAGDPPAKADKAFAPKALGMDVPVVTSADDLDKYVGRLVALRGVVSKTKLADIIGVWVATPDELRGREAYAVGILRKATVTEAEYRKMQDDARRDGNRIGIAHPGPGVYYELCTDLNWKQAKAQPLPKGAGK
jgi:hypothetical protein